MHAGVARLAWPVGLSLPAVLLAGGLAQLAYARGPLTALVVVAAAAALALALVRPLWLVGAAIIAIPLDILLLDSGPAVSPAEALFALSGLGWAAGRLAAGLAPVARAAVTVPLALLLIAVLLGLTVAVDQTITITRLGLWTCFTLMALLITEEATLPRVGALLGAVVAVGAVEGTLAVFGSGTWGPEERALGSFTQPNYLGGFLAVTLPLAFVATLRGRPTGRVLAACAAGAIIIGLLLSQSRGALIGAAASFVVLLGLPSFRRLAVIALVAGVALVAATSLGSNSTLGTTTQSVQVVENRFSQLEDSGAADPRSDIWAGSIELALDHPVLGIGLGNFPAHAPRYGILDDSTRVPFLHAHNLPLNIMVELGVLGLIAFLWLSAQVIVSLVRSARRGLRDQRLYAVGLLGSFTALALHGFADYLFTLNVMTAMLFVLLGCAMAVGRHQARGTHP